MSEEITASAEDLRDLEIARGLIAAGVAVFAAPPCPPGCAMRDKKGRQHKGALGKYHYPSGWENTFPSSAQLDRWKPGWALGLVGGRVVDALDEDPRSGGDVSVGELHAAGHWPMTFGEQQTSSGGRHYLIAATGERKEAGFMPGLDFQAGEPSTGKGGGEKLGRAFIWIAPTVRPSKDPANLGELVRYRWTALPDMEALEEYGETARESTEGIVSRVHAARLREKKREREPKAAPTPDPDDPFETSDTVHAADRSGFDEGRPFTLAEAKEFVRPLLMTLRSTQIGNIEGACNDAATGLYHFVDVHWTAEQAMLWLRDALTHTAYDPNGPSDWNVSKFEDVLDGTRPPDDNWKASRKPEPPEAQTVEAESPEEENLSVLERLRRRLVTGTDLAQAANPTPLVYGLLDLETECWMIGAPGSLKSFIALDIAAHVAAGREWWGHRVTQRDVLYIAAEGQRGMVLRTRAWLKKHPGQDMDRLTFLPYPVKVKNAEEWGALVTIAGEMKPGLIVIDTQARITVGMEENSNSDMNVLTDAIGRLKRITGACVLVIHHTGRDGKNARGASAIDGAQDTELKIIRGSEGKTPALQCEVVQDKQKDMAQDSGRGLVLDLEVIDLGVDSVTERPLSSLVVKGVGDPLRKAEGFTVTDGSPWVGKQPGDWTTLGGLVAPGAFVQRRILQVLADHGGLTGLTETGIREMITHRWGQEPKGDITAAVQKIKDLSDIVSNGSTSSRWTIDQVELRKYQGEV